LTLLRNYPAAPHLLCHRPAHVQKHTSQTSFAHLWHCWIVTFRGFRHFSALSWIVTLLLKRQLRGFSFLLLFLAFFGGGVQSALAQNATIEELIVTNSSTDLLLFLTVNNAFTKQMEEGIKNGIPVTFSFSVKLERKRMWTNQELVSLKFEHALSYDTLKEEYSVIRSEMPGQIFRTKSLNEAKKTMAQINGFTLSPLKALIPEAGYLLRVKAKLAEKTLPLYFHYVIPFWSLWDFETEWYTVEFRY